MKHLTRATLLLCLLASLSACGHKARLSLPPSEKPAKSDTQA